MARVLYARSFIDEMAQVETARIRANILDATELLSAIPEMGSRNLPRSVVRGYGDHVRKLVVPPFLVLYELHPDGDVLVLGVMHERAAW